MLDRVAKSKLINNLVIATTNSDKDQRLVDFLQAKQINFVRGSEEDVLARYYQSAQSDHQADDIIVRLTSDCPVIDYRIIDKVVQFYLDNDFDFVSNSLEPYSFPDGMDVEVFSFDLLRRAHEEAILPSHREHVTFYFWQNPDKFKIGYYQYPTNLSTHRLTLDYAADLELLRRVYEHFPDQEFTMTEVIDFLESHPEVAEINQSAFRNAGWQSALTKDKNFKQ